MYFGVFWCIFLCCAYEGCSILNFRGTCTSGDVIQGSLWKGFSMAARGDEGDEGNSGT